MSRQAALLRLHAVIWINMLECSAHLQVLTEYDDSEVDTVLEVTEKMHAHLTAAIVSNDALFVQKMLANTVNGTTYAGIRARCTGRISEQLTTASA